MRRNEVVCLLQVEYRKKECYVSMHEKIKEKFDKLLTEGKRTFQECDWDGRRWGKLPSAVGGFAQMLYDSQSLEMLDVMPYLRI